MNLQKGTYLQGNKYQIIDILGQGGFGTTYLAFQHGLNRKVAIKEFFMKDFCQRGEETTIVTMGTDSSRDMVAQFKKKFIKEAQTIAGLNDNHIIRIHDIFEENATAYYVMEYIEEGDLLKRIPEGGMREYDAIKTIQQVADALYYIHNHNILHLDIKPSNILFRKKDELVIIDFGISKHYDEEKGSQTSSTPIGISEGYAPLEQYEIGGVKDFSPATDIYSLGATLYHLLSGKCPPSASRIINKGLPALPDRITQQTKNAITKAMAFRQDNRPQTVAEFMQLLPGLYGNAPRENVQQEPPKEKVKVNRPVHKANRTFDNIRRWAVGICICMLVGLSILIFSEDIKSVGFSHSTNIQEDGFVDLGLSVKWEATNYGASSSNDAGIYVTWSQALEILGDSRLPTRAEAEELINKCKWEYNDRKKGYKVTGPNGNSIFLPLGGEKNDKNEIVSKDVLGYFWTFDRFNKNSAYVMATFRNILSQTITTDDNRKVNVRRIKTKNQ